MPDRLARPGSARCFPAITNAGRVGRWESNGCSRQLGLSTRPGARDEAIPRPRECQASPAPRQSAHPRASPCATPAPGCRPRAGTSTAPSRSGTTSTGCRTDHGSTVTSDHDNASNYASLRTRNFSTSTLYVKVGRSPPPVSMVAQRLPVLTSLP